MQAPAEGENIELLGGADLDGGNGDQVLSVSVDDLVDKLGWGAYQNRLMFQCGVFWSADAVEVMVMSIALHSIKEQWLLSDYEASFIPLVTFAGLLFGAPCWGIISDRRGRRFGRQSGNPAQQLGSPGREATGARPLATSVTAPRRRPLVEERIL